MDTLPLGILKFCQGSGKKQRANVARYLITLVMGYICIGERGYLFLVAASFDIANAQSEFMLHFPHGGFPSPLRAARMVK